MFNLYTPRSADTTLSLSADGTDSSQKTPGVNCCKVDPETSEAKVGAGVIEHIFRFQVFEVGQRGGGGNPALKQFFIDLRMMWEGGDTKECKNILCLTLSQSMSMVESEEELVRLHVNSSDNDIHFIPIDILKANCLGVVGMGRPSQYANAVMRLAYMSPF